MNLFHRRHSQNRSTHGHHLSAVVFLLLCILSTNAMYAQSATTLKTIAELRTWKSDSSQAPRLHLRGVVTYFDTVAPNLFVQDQTGGIWVDLRSFKGTPPQPGDILDLKGTAGIGFSPYVAEPSWFVIGRSALPKPISLVYEQAMTGRFDSQWSEIQGVVRSFVQQAEGNVLVIDVATPTGNFKVRVPNFKSGFPLQLVDATVRFKGVCGSSFNRRNQLVGFHLLMPSIEEAKVIEVPPANPFQLPISTIDHLRRFTGDVPDLHRVHIRGTVTARFPARGLFMTDGTGGVYVESQDGTPVQPGDLVDVLGFPASGDYSPVLKSGSIGRARARQNLQPLALAGSTALKGNYDAQLVRLTGVLHSEYLRNTTEVFSMEADDHTQFEAILEKQNGDQPRGIPQGSRISLTGICSVKADENGNPATFQLILRNTGDIQVLSSPPWLNLRRVLVLVAALIFISTAVTIWVLLLRRQVRQQARSMAQALKARLALETRYRQIFERNMTGLFLAEVDGKLLDCNSACARILGFQDRDDLINQLSSAENVIREVCRGVQESERIETEHRFSRPDGSWGWAISSARVVESPDGKRIIEGGLIDISDRKHAEQRVQFLAYYDALTGLPNRSLLEDRLGHALARAKRRSEQLAVIFIDLDGFKNINDSMGHSSGDMLLQEFGHRLQACAREQDTVARLGGDEFILILDGVANSDSISTITKRILRQVRTPFHISQRILNITCSVGVTKFPEHGDTAETLIKNADAAMYSAKEAGRNKVCLFDSTMATRSWERLTLESGLLSAVENGELFLEFQPEINLSTGKAICCEALLRWQHPELGRIAPDRFIGLAEDNGAIILMGEWVLRTACIESRRWNEQAGEKISVAVNVSAVQLRSPQFCDRVKQILTESSLDPELLELEVTESFTVLADESIFEVLRDLRTIGIKIAIDDFGTGYSSLSYLKYLPVDKLKIDRSFLRDLHHNSVDSNLLSAIVSLGKCMHMKITAEGVETDFQAEFLRKVGCDLAQGYLFCRPMPIENLKERISRGEIPGWNDKG